MKKIATILLAAISLGAAALLTSSSADARWVGYGGWRHGGGYGWGYRGWGWAPFAAGAVIGGALAAPYYYPYGPYPYYYYYYPYGPYPSYYYYGYRPGCCW